MNKKILNALEINNLLIVIGNDLSVVRLLKKKIPKYEELLSFMESAIDDGDFIQVNLIDYLAFWVWNQFSEKEPPSPYTLNKVVEVLVGENNTPEDDIKNQIKNFVGGFTDEEIVLDPFRKLVKISNFETILSVNFDNFLERAFEAENRRVNPSINFSIQNSDNSDGHIDRDKALASIFNIMGNINDSDFAITEEMQLEYLFSLLTGKDTKNEALYAAIKNKSILFIGCSFPNWFMRFFIRTITKKRYKDGGSSKFVASDRASQDIDLSTFLENFKMSVIPIGILNKEINNNETVYSNTVEFIDELFEKTQNNSAIITGIKPLYKEKIFLSYSRRDESIVGKIRNEFEKCGVELFFDNDDLRNGDDFAQSIFEYIMTCDFFLPIISKNSIESKEKYVYKDEWIPAINFEKMKIHSKSFKEGQKNYIRPYIIDDTSPTDDRIPDVIRSRDITSITSEDDFPAMVRKFIKTNSLTQIK